MCDDLIANFDVDDDEGPPSEAEVAAAYRTLVRQHVEPGDVVIGHVSGKQCLVVAMFDGIVALKHPDAVRRTLMSAASERVEEIAAELYERLTAQGRAEIDALADNS